MILSGYKGLNTQNFIQAFMEIPFVVMALITMTWVLIGAVLIMPHFAEKKMTRKGGRIDTLESGFNTKLDSMETLITARVSDVDVQVANIQSQITASISELDAKVDAIKFPEMPVIPDNIPDMTQITKLIEDGRENTVKVLEDVQLRLSKNMQHINENIPIHISNGIKSMEGRMYRAKGINMQDHEKGIDAAKEVILEGIENKQDQTPIMQIVRHFVNVAADAELIDPENADQKIGLVQGILEGVKMFQNRGESPMGGNALMSSSGRSSLPSSGDGMDGYYR